jgi:hypothetical protein
MSAKLRATSEPLRGTTHVCRGSAASHPQSRNGSTSPLPAITTANGRSVQDADRACMTRQHVRKPPVGFRTFVQIDFLTSGLNQRDCFHSASNVLHGPFRGAAQRRARKP